MSKWSMVTQTAAGRAAMGFMGTASVLIGTTLFAPDASAAAPVAIQRAASPEVVQGGGEAADGVDPNRIA